MPPESPTSRPKATARLKYDPEPRRDWIRIIIAVALMAALLLLFGFAGYSTHGDFDKMMKLLDKVLAPLTTLIGVAMTFYFKNSSR